MKRIFSTFVLMLLVAGILSAATISSPAATVKLTKNYVINMSQLDSEVAFYRNNGYPDITPQEVLDVMIEDVLVEQGAERDGYSISDGELESVYLGQKANIEQQIGRALSLEEFESVIAQNYGSVDTYKTLLKQEYVFQNYVYGLYGDKINNPAQPSDTDIKTWYRQNASTSFAEPEMVRLSIIAKAKTGEKAKDDSTRKTLEGAYKAINSNGMSFERAVQLYSEDTASVSIGGDWGYLTDNPGSRERMGNAFVDECMLLEVGETAGVFETSEIFCIAKCTDHRDPRVLGLEDTIEAYGITVREYIIQGLLYQNSQLAYIEACNELIQNLRSQAKINIMYK